tara:strand:- start:4607 stop:5308 length:702 start_codon:yes stop_codon:yes gene_type:complete
MSLVPVLTMIVGVFGWFADPAKAANLVGYLEGLVPPAIAELLEDELRDLATNKASAGVSALLAGLVSLWAGSKAMDSVIKAMNMAYDVEERRNLVVRKLVGFALTLGTVIVVVAAGWFLVIATTFAGVPGIILTLAKWPLIFVTIGLWLSLVYRFAPARDGRWHWVTYGSFVATLLWVISSAAFTIYATQLGNFNQTYGSLGAIVALMLWFYLSALALVLGAEINAELEEPAI